MAFNASHYASVNGDALNVVHGNQFNTTYHFKDPDKVLEFVAAYASPNAFHNSEERFPPPNCHPGTRTEILLDCNQWIVEKAPSARVFWIQGPAGVGKSAIMQNLSEKHAQQQSARHKNPRLSASFFFSRNDSTRDKLDPFVATIVYQFLTIGSLRAALGPSIIETIRSNPHIFRTSFEDQFQKLIVEPYSKVDRQKRNKLPNLVVIDGIDECILIPSQERLIAMIRRAISSCPIRFLLASRPEPRICRAFKHASFASLLHHLVIGDSEESTRDITTYFHASFSQLQDTHPALCHLDVSWPGEEKIRKLVERACGQFIFAVTVMKYLESDDESPSRRLEDVLRIRVEDLPQSPYPALDLLYCQILKASPNWGEVCSILCLLTFEGSAVPAQLLVRSPKGIGALLQLESGRVESLLFRLHSVLEVPSDGGPIHIFHASFTEYLLDPTRSKEYYVEAPTESGYYDLVARAFLRAISIQSQEYLQSPSNFIPGHLYISNYLASKHSFVDVSLFAVFHFIHQVKSPSDGLLADLNQFDPYPFATWLLNWGVSSIPRIRHLDAWNSAIQWAMSLGPRAPSTFLRRMVSFLFSFCIGSTATNASASLSNGMAFLDQMFYMLTDARYNSRDHNVYHPRYHVFSASQAPNSLSMDFTITREKAETIDRILTSLGECNVELLVQDIRNDTYQSVRNLDLDKHTDLYTLKKLVAQRRQDFGLPVFPFTLPRQFRKPREAGKKLT